LENIMVPTQGDESRAEASMGQRQDVEQVREWRRPLPPPWDLRFFHAREQLLFGNCTVKARFCRRASHALCAAHTQHAFCHL